MLNHPVPEHLLARIGDITVSFAMLESQIQTVAGSLICEHQRIGQIITAEVSFSNLRALVLNLYRERHGDADPDLADLDALMKRAAQLEEDRNRVTHSVWGAGETPNSITRIKMTSKERRGVRFTFEATSDADLAAIANGLKELAGEIQGFYLRLIWAGKLVNNPNAPIWGPGAQTA